jgi:hypothetical protein
MTKLSTFATVLAVSAAFAAPALAGDLRVANPSETTVRIPVAGKSAAQLELEIKAAAATVCVAVGEGEGSCVTEAITNAHAQLAALTASGPQGVKHFARLDVVRGDQLSVHVKVAGKTLAQLQGEIQQAAAKVCEVSASDKAEYSECVSTALQDAQRQLHDLAANG